MNWGWRYDLLVVVADVLLRGKLRQLRLRAVDLADLQPGEAVLDVGGGGGAEGSVIGVPISRQNPSIPPGGVTTMSVRHGSSLVTV